MLYKTFVILVIAVLFMCFFLFEKPKLSRKLIFIVLIPIIAISLCFGYFFPQDTKPKSVSCFLDIDFKDREGGRFFRDQGTRYVNFYFHRDYTRILIECTPITDFENTDVLLSFDVRHFSPFDWQSLKNKDITIYVISTSDFDWIDSLKKPIQELRKELYVHRIEYYVNTEDRNCYLDLSSIKNEVDNENLWICFDAKKVEFERQVYIHIGFTSSKTPNRLSLWVDETYDIMNYHPEGRPYAERIDFEVDKQSIECSLKVRKLEFFDEAWFVAIFATLLSMISFYFTFWTRKDSKHNQNSVSRNQRVITFGDDHRSKPDLNKVALAELIDIPGIDSRTAGRILQSKPFRSWEDISKIKGIGEKRLSYLKKYFRI